MGLARIEDRLAGNGGSYQHPERVAEASLAVSAITHLVSRVLLQLGRPLLELLSHCRMFGICKPVDRLVGIGLQVVELSEIDLTVEPHRRAAERARVIVR